ncbi:MAG: bifunctional folylpolyglutamate synthase/dihydrofolate synthase [Clostridiales bacterium]|nr:bifunctional folylpolyglutamate synthase/dihydrofolate synthase [Clostridiales bacterium]
MNYDESIEYIHSVYWKGTKLGLERIKALLEAIGHPESKLKFIHIAGTNGKGSTAAMLSSMLVQAGYRTGLYTSPYIVRFNERMQIDGVPISDEDLAEITTWIKPYADVLENHPTEFEMVTAIALEWFARSECEIVVLEVGMGGEFDATNAVSNTLVSVLTNIGLDHTQYLGDTVEEIASTKAGIIKPGSTCVLYEQSPEVTRVISDVCAARDVPLFIASMDALTPVSRDLTGQVFDWKGLRSLEIPLLGAHQLHNAATALTVIETLTELGMQISEESIRRGLRKTAWPGRFQVVGEKPLFLIDGGHNPQCLDALTKALQDYLPGRKAVFLVGCMADKDYENMFSPLAPFAERFVTVTPDNPRALRAEELAMYLSAWGLQAEAAESVEQGVRRAMEAAGEDGVVCACGSLYMIADVLKGIEEARGR